MSGSVTIPDTGNNGHKITALADECFKENGNITKVNIGNNVTVIGTKAFYDCTALETVSVNTETIPDDTFYGSAALKNVTLGSKVKSIGSSAFGHSESRTAGNGTLTIPSNVETIGANAFSYMCLDKLVIDDYSGRVYTDAGYDAKAFSGSRIDAIEFKKVTCNSTDDGRKIDWNFGGANGYYTGTIIVNQYFGANADLQNLSSVNGIKPRTLILKAGESTPGRFPISIINYGGTVGGVDCSVSGTKFVNYYGATHWTWAVVNKPTALSPKPEYNGTEQYGILPSGSYYAASGTLSATDAGNYSAMVALRPGCTWVDGNINSYPVNWSIEQTRITVKARYMTVKYGDPVPFNDLGEKDLIVVNGGHVLTPGQSLSNVESLSKPTFIANSYTTSSNVDTRHDITIQTAPTSKNFIIGIADEKGSLYVSKADVTLKAKDIYLTRGSAVPVFAANGTYLELADGTTLKNNESLDGLAGLSCSFSCAYTPSSAAGSYPITLSDLDSSNYNITSYSTPGNIIVRETPASDPEPDIITKTVVITDPVTGTVTTTTTTTVGGKVTSEIIEVVTVSGEKTVKTEVYNTDTGDASKAEKTGTGSKVETNVGVMPTVAEDKATAQITSASITGAIENSKRAAVAAGIDEAKPVVVMKVNQAAESAKQTAVEITSASMRELAEAKAEIKIVSATGTVELDSDAVSTMANIGAASKVEITIGKADPADLSERQRETVGDSPVFKIYANVGGTSVHELYGKATITVDYTPKAGENTDSIVIYFVNDDGQLYERKTVYADGKLTFESETFSFYVAMQRIAVPEPASGSGMLYIAAAIVAIAIASAGFLYYRRSSA